MHSLTLVHQHLLTISGCNHFFILRFPGPFGLCAQWWDCEHIPRKKNLLPEEQLHKKLAAEQRLRAALLKSFSILWPPYALPSLCIPVLCWPEIPNPADSCLCVLFLLELQDSLSKGFWTMTFSLRPKGTVSSVPSHVPHTLATAELWGAYDDLFQTPLTLDSLASWYDNWWISPLLWAENGWPFPPGFPL